MCKMTAIERKLQNIFTRRINLNQNFDESFFEMVFVLHLLMICIIVSNDYPLMNIIYKLK